MEGDVVFYNIFKRDLGNGVHNLPSDTLQITLHTGYEPDIDADHVWSDVSATEYATGSGYTQGGKELASVAWAVDDLNNRADFSAAIATWTSLGALSPATPSHAIIWNNTPTSPADPLICYIELGVTATNGGDYSIDGSGDIGRLS